MFLRSLTPEGETREKEGQKQSKISLNIYPRMLLTERNPCHMEFVKEHVACGFACQLAGHAD